MDGLEISEIYYSKIIDKENSTYRIDSEYFKKKYLHFIELLKNKNAVDLSPKFKVGGGKRLPLNAEFSNNGYKYARAEDVKGLFLDIEKSPYISKETHEVLKNYITEKEDILLTIVGNSIGDLAINKQNEIINLTENCVRIYSNDNQTSLLYCFLKSKFGQFQIEREKVGTAQPKLAIERIRRFAVILNFSEFFIKKINELVSNSWNCILDSKLTYKNVESLLTNKLDIPVAEPKATTVKMKSFSFDLSGRLDAEYYQPKYENIENQIDCTNTIITSCEIRDENYTPKENELYQYIELANVDSMGGISTVDKIQGKELPSRARRLVKTGQVIISSVEGSLQSCALITEEFNNALCSTGFYVLDSEKYNSETLLVLFKSEATQALLKKRCSGTILTAISKEEFEKMPLPEVDGITQNAIKEKVQESFRLRKKSKELLDIAVKAVEMAIETDEESALAWLGAQNV